MKVPAFSQADEHVPERDMDYLFRSHDVPAGDPAGRLWPTDRRVMMLWHSSALGTSVECSTPAAAD